MAKELRCKSRRGNSKNRYDLGYHDGPDLLGGRRFELVRAQLADGAEGSLPGQAGDVAAGVTVGGPAQLVDLFIRQRTVVFRQKLS